MVLSSDEIDQHTPRLSRRAWRCVQNMVLKLLDVTLILVGLYTSLLPLLEYGRIWSTIFVILSVFAFTQLVFVQRRWKRDVEDYVKLRGADEEGTVIITGHILQKERHVNPVSNIVKYKVQVQYDFPSELGEISHLAESEDIEHIVERRPSSFHRTFATHAEGAMDVYFTKSDSDRQQEVELMIWPHHHPSSSASLPVLTVRRQLGQIRFVTLYLLPFLTVFGPVVFLTQSSLDQGMTWFCLIGPFVGLSPSLSRAFKALSQKRLRHLQSPNPVIHTLMDELWERLWFRLGSTSWQRGAAVLFPLAWIMTWQSSFVSPFFAAGSLFVGIHSIHTYGKWRHHIRHDFLVEGIPVDGEAMSVQDVRAANGSRAFRRVRIQYSLPSEPSTTFEIERDRILALDPLFSIAPRAGSIVPLRVVPGHPRSARPHAEISLELFRTFLQRVLLVLLFIWLYVVSTEVYNGHLWLFNVAVAMMFPAFLLASQKRYRTWIDASMNSAKVISTPSSLVD